MICTRYKYKKCLSLDEYFSSMLLLGLLDVTTAIGVEANLDGIEASRRRRGIEAGLDVRDHGVRALSGTGIEAASRLCIEATSRLHRGLASRHRGRGSAPPMTEPLVWAVSNTTVRLSRELMGVVSKNSSDSSSGRRPMCKSDECFETTPISSRDIEV